MILIYRCFSAILSYLQKPEKTVYFFPLILRIQSALQMCCNPTICFKIRIIKLFFISMISHPLPNVKSQFSKKEELVVTTILH